MPLAIRSLVAFAGTLAPAPALAHQGEHGPDQSGGVLHWVISSDHGLFWVLGAALLALGLAYLLPTLRKRSARTRRRK